uniref:Uncharacterized protein n=1 Tax=Anguilla anguilla TaxID=7936 RepID=A0A0E9T1V2_ANGAN
MFYFCFHDFPPFSISCLLGWWVCQMAARHLMCRYLF